MGLIAKMNQVRCCEVAADRGCTTAQAADLLIDIGHEVYIAHRTAATHNSAKLTQDPGARAH